MYLVVLRLTKWIRGHARDLILVVSTISMHTDREILALVRIPVQLNFEPLVLQHTFALWIESITEGGSDLLLEKHVIRALNEVVHVELKSIEETCLNPSVECPRAFPG